MRKACSQAAEVSIQFQGETTDGALRGQFKSSGIRPYFLPRAEYYGLDRPLLELI
jgi:pilus assembly protein CpaF